MQRTSVRVPNQKGDLKRISTLKLVHRVFISELLLQYAARCTESEPYPLQVSELGVGALVPQQGPSGRRGDHVALQTALIRSQLDSIGCCSG